MSSTFAVLSNLLIPAAFVGVLDLVWSPTAALVAGALYVAGGVVTLLFIERGGGENRAVVFTGWYSGPLFGFIGLLLRL